MGGFCCGEGDVAMGGFASIIPRVLINDYYGIYDLRATFRTRKYKFHWKSYSFDVRFVRFHKCYAC